jgi:hypothetical protein
MNGLQKSAERAMAYLPKMFPGYAWGKTAGGGLLDFMGAPPPDSPLPMLFVESKMGNDTLRESQNGWAKSEIGLRCKKYVIYADTTKDDAPLFLYSWDDYLQFVECENALDPANRKSAERAAARVLEPSLHVVQQETGGASAKVRVEHGGKCTALAGSIFRGEDQPCIAESTTAQMRKDMRDKGVLQPQPDGTLKLTVDTPFSSPSAAASVILGRWGSPVNFETS